MIYLASPYSDPDPIVREKRFAAACLAAASLIGSGEAVFSPIVHGHPLVHYGLPADWAFCNSSSAEIGEVIVVTSTGNHQRSTPARTREFPTG